jgi:hypothetical protein
MDDQKEVHLSEREQMEISLIRSLMISYFSIVRQTIQDLVPKGNLPPLPPPPRQRRGLPTDMHHMDH